MSERYWPKDALGNDVRKGQLVSLRIPEQVLVCRVADVIEAGFSGEDKERIELQGALNLVVQIPYTPNRAVVGQVLCLKEPEESRIHRA
jgi:hypothetical protein